MAYVHTLKGAAAAKKDRQATVLAAGCSVLLVGLVFGGLLALPGDLSIESLLPSLSKVAWLKTIGG